MNNLHESQRRRGAVYREPRKQPKRLLDKVIMVMGYLLSCYMGFLIAYYIL